MSEMIYDFAIHSLYYDKTDMIVPMKLHNKILGNKK